MFYNLCFLFSLCEQVIIKRWGTLTDFGKFHPPQKNPPSVFIYLITKLSDNLTEPIDDYCHGHFELKSVYKWIFLYKWPLYDHSWPFFRHMCVCIFHKTEVLTVILRCLMGLNLDWVKRYGLKCSLRHSASSANSQKIATDK
jgi:hypothetical protein